MFAFLPECEASGWLGVSGEMAGVSGVTATAGFWGGAKCRGFVLGATGEASFTSFWLMRGEDTGGGWGGFFSWIVSGSAVIFDFPPSATGGGISSSLTDFPFLTDVSMDCSVLEQTHHNYQQELEQTSKLITASLKYSYLPVTFNPRSYLLTLLVSPASLALEMAVLYISKRSRRRDSSPVAPLGAGGFAGWDVMAPLGASGVTAGGVGAGVSSSSSSKTSFSSAYTQKWSMLNIFCSLQWN